MISTQLKNIVGFCLALLFLVWPAPAPASAQASRFTPPDEARLQDILAQVDAYAPEAMAKAGVPGMSVAIVADDRVVFIKGYGTKALGGGGAVTTRTIFQMGSCSKAFTSVLMAAVIDGGLVGWEDRVIDHLPGFAMKDGWVTDNFLIDDLMAQRSGLTEYAGDPQAYLGFNRDHIIHSLRYFPPASSFRSQFAYQNGFFMAAAQVIEKYTGLTWEEALKKQLLNPLGMTSTTSDQAGYDNAPDRALMYAVTGDGPVHIPDDMPYNSWCYIYGPAGGVNSNAKDMAQWVRFHLGDGSFQGQSIISPANLKWLHTPHTIINRPFYSDLDYYCLGWFYSTYSPYPMVQHGGNTLGAHSLVSLVPQAGIGVVVLSNTGASMGPEAVAWRFFDLYFGNPLRDVFAGRGKSAPSSLTLRDLPGFELPPGAHGAQPGAVDATESLSPYIGIYQSPIYETALVEADGDGLALILGPHDTVMTLTPRGGRTFSLHWAEGLYFYGKSEVGLVRFDEAAPQGAGAMTVDMLNSDGGGVFTRRGAGPR